MRYCLVLICFLSLFLASACKSKFEKLKESGDLAYKYEQAVSFFNQGRALAKAKKRGSFKYFQQAQILYASLNSAYKGTSKAENVAFGWAASTYYLGIDLIEAQMLYKSLADQYPNGQYAEQARFMVAKCLFDVSPNTSELDQSATHSALLAIQFFLDLYPNSKKTGECNAMVDQLRGKLEEKSYKNAKLYLTIRDYKPAIIALKNSLKEFPDSKFREEIEFLIVKSHYLYAKNSYLHRQEARFEQTRDASIFFKEMFPSSQYIPALNIIQKDTEKQLAYFGERKITDTK